MVESGDTTSKSQAVNQLCERGEKVNELEARNDDLRRQLQQANSQNEHVDDLAEYVDGERELQAMERERRNAPIWDRVRWLIFGRD